MSEKIINLDRRPVDILKSMVKRSSYLYPIAHRLNGNRWSSFTSKKTDICLEGYPSSANSFIYNVLKKAFCKKNISHHTHTIANVKKAMKLNVPTLVLIRSPKEAISSRCVRFNIETKEAIIQYYEFYEYIRSVKDRIFLLDFKGAVSRTSSAIKKFESYSGLEMTNEIDDQVENEIKREIKKWSKNNNKKSGSLPSEEKNIRKEEYKRSISKNKYYGRSKKIFKLLNGM